jgi:uncharacterized protein
MSDDGLKHVSDRTRIRRLPKRGVYERDTIYRIVDDALIGHVGIVSEGSPVVIPMAVARRNDDLLLHGSTASRLTRSLAAGADVCVCISHLDGVVVARSVFDNSMNYRSVVIFGRASPLTEPTDKLEALRTLVEHLIPGRWQEARHPSEKELRATTILTLPLDEASAKVRSGPPQDDEADLSLPVWAGEIPLRMTSLPPIPDPTLSPQLSVSESVTRFGARLRNEGT